MKKILKIIIPFLLLIIIIHPIANAYSYELSNHNVFWDPYYYKQDEKYGYDLYFKLWNNYSYTTLNSDFIIIFSIMTSFLIIYLCLYHLFLLINNKKYIINKNFEYINKSIKSKKISYFLLIFLIISFIIYKICFYIISLKEFKNPSLSDEISNIWAKILDFAELIMHFTLIINSFIFIIKELKLKILLKEKNININNNTFLLTSIGLLSLTIISCILLYYKPTITITYVSFNY